MLYHTGNSQHTQNIQINNIIAENEKCVSYFTEKMKQTLWPTQYLILRRAFQLTIFPHTFLTLKVT